MSLEAQPSHKTDQWDCYMWERTMNLHSSADSHDSDDVKVPHFIGWTVQSTTAAVADASCR